jgi:hypothetical protein
MRKLPGTVLPNDREGVSPRAEATAPVAIVTIVLLSA